MIILGHFRIELIIFANPLKNILPDFSSLICNNWSKSAPEQKVRSPPLCRIITCRSERFPNVSIVIVNSSNNLIGIELVDGLLKITFATPS